MDARSIRSVVPIGDRERNAKLSASPAFSILQVQARTKRGKSVVQLPAILRLSIDVKGASGLILEKDWRTQTVCLRAYVSVRARILRFTSALTVMMLMNDRPRVPRDDSVAAASACETSFRGPLPHFRAE